MPYNEVPENNNDSDPGPAMPASPELEKFIIGSLLVSQSCEAIIELDLKPEYFFISSYREIAMGLRAMAEDGAHIDPVLLHEKLLERKSLVDGATIADAYGGATRFSVTPDHIKRLRDYAIRRAVLRAANLLYQDAQSASVSTEDLVEDFQHRASSLTSETSLETRPANKNTSELLAMEFEKGDEILCSVERGEVLNLSAYTGLGKTTLIRNVMFSAACGRGFAPWIKPGPARRILYLDFETRERKLKWDITTMLTNFSYPERQKIIKNIDYIADYRVGEEPFDLSKSSHWKILEKSMRDVKPDIVVVDTLTMAFNIQDENNNAECTAVAKRLIYLATKFNCVVIYLHHIGKQKLEGGGYVRNKSRGSSAFEGCAPAVIYLIDDKNDPDTFTVKCSKIKGDSWPDVGFKIDKKKRWCNQMDDLSAPLPEKSALEKILEVVTDNPVTFAYIRAMLPSIGMQTLRDTINEAVKNGLLGKIGKGKSSCYMKQKSLRHAFLRPNRESESMTNQLLVENKDVIRHGKHFGNGLAMTNETGQDFTDGTDSNPADDPRSH